MIPGILLVLAAVIGIPMCMAVEDDLWGTFRPHALISARARVRNSPFFGFVYHPADNFDVRHLATDDHDKVRSFSWSRHNGRSFGDQSIEDVDANLLLETSFLKHPTEQNAWVLRVSGEALNNDKEDGPISMVFYGAAAPDEIDPRIGKVDSSLAHEWGSLSFSDNNEITSDGLEGDVKLHGSASSVGGSYQIVVKEPNYGSVSPSTFSLPQKDRSVDDVTVSFSGTGSRARMRCREDKPSVEASTIQNFHASSVNEDPSRAWAIEKLLQGMLRKSRSASGRDSSSDSRRSISMLEDHLEDSTPVVFVQRILEVPFQMEAVFVSSEGRTPERMKLIEDDITGDRLSSKLENIRSDFDRKFEDVFGLQQKSLPDQELKFAKSALSNVLGGIGYFYGSSVTTRKGRRQSADSEIEFLNPVGLLSATPSRALFPRGFLWDEGFHQLVVQRWDPDLSQQCMLSWLGLMQESGWIPREQILGLEARSRFPEHVRHLMIQNPSVANPPTLLMPLRVLASLNVKGSGSGEDMNETCETGTSSPSGCVATGALRHDLAVEVLEKSIRYYQWLKRTQSGEASDTFRWRGRSADIKAPEGYPLTLASGLDDYPRAISPNKQERHLDLHCWMTWASGALAQLSQATGRDGSHLRNEQERLKSSMEEFYSASDPERSEREHMLLCDFDGRRQVCHEGYVTILPLILGLLDPADARVSAILDALEDPSLLRASAGIRSLSRSDMWYRKGDDYWTGSVWMPFNFLTLAALRTKYAVAEGPYKIRAGKVFSDLRDAILQNSFNVFLKTGQLWENYSPGDDGSGKSGRQFTGWSALVLLMYADMFDGVV